MSNGRTLNVLVTGGSGPSGIATARALRDAGHRVFTVGSNAAHIEAAAAEAGGGITPLVSDLASLAEVRALRASVAGMAGNVDGVIHLVGGWRGAKGITDQSDEDWDFLERNAVTTLRNVTRVFFDDLAASDTGRFAMVSSTAVSTPTAGGASYAAAKAAAEAWTLAVADGFRRAHAAAAGAGNTGQESPDQEKPQLRSAATIFVVKALVDPGMRAKAPERSFPGFTDVADLAAAAAGLFSTPAGELNGQRLLLSR
ncbi:MULTISPECIES: SDR family oxidoreductase [unclassified Arthrobacter]|uniref:SDR family oxidoreductase n=1 Tax=unclassified Arthrobacter TaxID=235627 RepID=UPI001D81D56B|nr:SDR family oxidoreductase [Arthrobacter sp. Bi26]CAH0184538.1 putative oxidoreductase Rv0484c [Arthrobacter sp. Bi26]